MAEKKMAPRKEARKPLTRKEVQDEARRRLEALAGRPLAGYLRAEMFDDRGDAANAREVYLGLVSALRAAQHLVKRAPPPDDDQWTNVVRLLFDNLNEPTAAWLSVALDNEATDRLRGPEDWTPRRRLLRYWHTIGVPWRPGRRPSQGDLALISLATLGTLPGVRIDDGDSFDDLLARETESNKTEWKRLRREDAGRAEVMRGDSKTT